MKSALYDRRERVLVQKYKDGQLHSMKLVEKQTEEEETIQSWVIMSEDIGGVAIKIKDRLQKFVDLEFRPSRQKVGDFEGLEKEVQWSRLSDIVKRGCLFNKPVSYAHLLQYGNCQNNLLSSLLALAVYDWPISRIFLEQSVLQLGLIFLSISKNGTAQTFVIDDFVPTSNHRLLFSKAEKGEVWPQLLQKCWAKLTGSYSHMYNAEPREVLQTFTNRAVVQWSTQLEYYFILARLKEGIQRRYPSLAISSDKQGISELGLLNSHPYPIIGVYQVWAGLTLVKLLNTWKVSEWLGEYSNSSQNWGKVSVEKKEQIGYGLSKNVFFIPYEKFRFYFSSLLVCHLSPKLKQTRLDIASDGKHCNYFSFIVVEKEQTVVLAIHFNKAQGKKLIVLVAHLISHANVEYVDAFSEWKLSDITRRLFLKPGRYLVYTKLDGQKSTYTVLLQSQRKISMQLVQRKKFKGQGVNKFLLMFFQSRAKQVLNKQLFWMDKGSKMRKPDYQITTQLMAGKSDFAYLQVETSQSMPNSLKLQLNIALLQERGFVIKKPFKGRIACFQIKNGRSEIVLMRLRGPVRKAIRFPQGIRVSQSLV